jgi:dUTP pyrophosphatase
MGYNKNNDFKKENENGAGNFYTERTTYHKRYTKRRTRRPFIVEVVLTEDATTLQLPVYKTNGSAGADLKALTAGECKAGELCTLVRTGVKIKIPRGYEGQIRPRSGLSIKGLQVVNTPGTIDSDYRGELMINFFNSGKETIKWEAGERIAQLVIAPVKRAVFEVKTNFSPDRYENERNENGFGSTGNA